MSKRIPIFTIRCTPQQLLLLLTHYYPDQNLSGKTLLELIPLLKDLCKQHFISDFAETEE